MHPSKKIDKEAYERNKIAPQSLIKGAVVGRIILYDVRFYDNKGLFLKDRKKHFTGTGHTDPVFGFLLNSPKN